MSERWSARRHVALALADALLAGLPIRSAAMQRCAEALGGQPSWLPALVQAALRRFARAWRPALRHELAQFLSNHRLSESWLVAPPQVRRWYFNVPVMEPPRLGLGGAALALPDLPTTGDIADWLGLPLPRLLWLADPQLRNPRATDARLRHYVLQAVPKRHGGWRLIEAPKYALREAQRRITRELLDYVPLHEAAHGFRRHHSPLTHARLHVGQAVVMRFDLEDFFLSIGRARVNAVFTTLGYPPAAATTLAALCTAVVARADFDACIPLPSGAEAVALRWQQRQRHATPHLPQGAPSSPALANLCAFRLDLRLTAAAEAFGGRYSRYADDLVFSGDASLARSTARLADLVARIVTDEGFRLNHRKARVMRRGVRQQVTGLIVNDRLNVSREHFDGLKATLHNCVRHGWPSQNRAGLSDFRAHLAGRIAQIGAANAARGARLQRLFDAVDWSTR